MSTRVSRTVVTRPGVVHWCPREGTAWTCPTCGEQFARASERHSWLSAAEKAAA